MKSKACFAVLSSALLTVLSISPAVAKSSNEDWLAHAQFAKTITSKKQSAYTLLASETKGIALVSSDNQVNASIQASVEHLDFRFINDQQGILATLDKNSGELLLVEVNLATKSLAIVQRFKPDNMAFDALCLQNSDTGIDLFAIDVQGSARHYNVFNKQLGSWQQHEINRFAVGPNIKSCAVAETFQTLLVTEENIGVWQYSTDPEHEVVRELIRLPEGLAIEYVDTTEAGDVVIVSPDINKFWSFDLNNNELSEHLLNEGVAPKTVQVTRLGKQLKVSMFDDEQETLIEHSFDREAVKRAKSISVTSLLPYAETLPVESYGDAADDPAIWQNKLNPNASLVFTTDKKAGLNIYDLQGKLVQKMPVGRINNVDIRYDVQLGTQRVDIVAASNRTSNSITVFAIDQMTGKASLISDISTDLADPYGLCLSHINGELDVWINDTDGRFQQYRLALSGQNATAKKVLEWQVPSQPEGCVVDDSTGRLFYGEESTGVWLKDIDSNTPDTLITGLAEGVAADIEGMGLYQLAGKNYLVVSSQGNNRYAVYAVDDGNRLLGTFTVGANWQQMIDGASETDGLAVTSLSFTDALPNGLLVVQDGHNMMPKAKQNFKLVDGRLLALWIENNL